jgi:hypothetical protein
VRAPSEKALLSAFPSLTPANAKLIRMFAKATDDGEKLKTLVDAYAPKTAKYVQSLYSGPYRSQIWRVTVSLHAMNEIMDLYGVEGLGPGRSGDYAPPYEYLNTGDTYGTTLIYSRDGDNLRIGNWGDIAERHPEWE